VAVDLLWEECMGEDRRDVSPVLDRGVVDDQKAVVPEERVAERIYVDEQGRGHDRTRRETGCRGLGGRARGLRLHGRVSHFHARGGAQSLALPRAGPLGARHRMEGATVTGWIGRPRARSPRPGSPSSVTTGARTTRMQSTEGASRIAIAIGSTLPPCQQGRQAVRWSDTLPGRLGGPPRRARPVLAPAATVMPSFLSCISATRESRAGEGTSPVGRWLPATAATQRAGRHAASGDTDRTRAGAQKRRGHAHFSGPSGLILGRLPPRPEVVEIDDADRVRDATGHTHSLDLDLADLIRPAAAT